MQQVTKMYKVFTEFFVPENEGCFWVGAGMCIRENLLLLQKLLHLPGAKSNYEKQAQNTLVR